MKKRPLSPLQQKNQDRIDNFKKVTQPIIDKTLNDTLKLAYKGGEQIPIFTIKGIDKVFHSEEEANKHILDLGGGKVTLIDGDTERKYRIIPEPQLSESAVHAIITIIRNRIDGALSAADVDEALTDLDVMYRLTGNELFNQALIEAQNDITA